MSERRFLIIEHDEDAKCGHAMSAIDEQLVSQRIDMADCYDGPFAILCLGTDGKLYPVEVRNHTRVGMEEMIESNSVVCGHADLVIHQNPEKPEVVGYVTYTDH